MHYPLYIYEDFGQTLAKWCIPFFLHNISTEYVDLETPHIQTLYQRVAVKIGLKIVWVLCLQDC